MSIHQINENLTRLGQIETPSYIVSFMYNLVGYGLTQRSFGWRILDPGVGTGNFLYEGVNRFLSNWKKNKSSNKLNIKQLHKILKRKFVGIDIDTEKIKVTKIKLNHLYNQIIGGSNYPEWSLFNQNFLTWKDEYENHIYNLEDIIIENNYVFPSNLFDLIIGNPPYVRYEYIDKTILEFYKNKYQTAVERFDLYHLFVEKGYNLLRNGGQINFIMPKRFIKGKTGLKLRNLLLKKSKFKNIVNFKDYEIFNNYLPYPFIINFVKKIPNKEDEFNYYNIVNDENKENKIEKILEKINHTTSSSPYLNKLKQIDLNPKNLIFNSNQLNMILNKINKNSQGLFEEFYIKYTPGTATGRKKVFVLNQEQIDDLNLEKELIRKFIDPKCIEANKIKSHKFLITPYKQNSSGDTYIIPEEYLKTEYPYIFRYLAENIDDLKSRTCVKDGDLWYRFHEHPNLNRFNQPKIFIPDIYNKSHFIMDEKGEYHPGHSIYFMITESIEKLISFKKVLNTNLYDKLIKLKATRQKNGYYRFQSQFIRNLPYPNIDDKIIRDSQDIEKLLFESFNITAEEFRIIVEHCKKH